MASQPSPYSSQLIDAQAEELARLQAVVQHQEKEIRRLRKVERRLTTRLDRLEQVRFCGVMGDMAVLNDDGGWKTSFSLQKDQRLMDGIYEVDARFATE